MLRNLHAVVGGGARFWAFVVLTAASAVIQAAAVLWNGKARSQTHFLLNP